MAPGGILNYILYTHFSDNFIGFISYSLWGNNMAHLVLETVFNLRYVMKCQRNFMLPLVLEGALRIFTLVIMILTLMLISLQNPVIVIFYCNRMLSANTLEHECITTRIIIHMISLWHLPIIKVLTTLSTYCWYWGVLASWKCDCAAKF